MNPSPRYCGMCGSALTPGARFCGQCGHQVRQTEENAPIQYQPPPSPPRTSEPLPPDRVSAPGETILGVIPYAQRRKGLFGVETFNLVITPGRIVFAYVTSQMLKEEALKASQSAKEEGKGWLGRTFAVWGSSHAMLEKYYQMPVDSILAEHTDNFSLLHTQVKSARFKHEFDEDKSTDKLVLDTSSGKFTFEINQANPKDAKNLLKQVLGNRVR